MDDMELAIALSLDPKISENDEDIKFSIASSLAYHERNDEDEVEKAITESIDELKSSQHAIKRLNERKDILQRETGGFLLSNEGKGNCLLLVRRQILDRHSKSSIKAETVSLKEDRIKFIERTRKIHDSYSDHHVIEFSKRKTLRISLNYQRAARKIPGRFLGNYTQADVPSDVDTLAHEITEKFKQYHIVIDSKGNDLQMWVTEHGDNLYPMARFSLVFTEAYKTLPGHYELLQLPGYDDYGSSPIVKLELSNECDFDFDENLEKNKHELLMLEKQLDFAYDRLKIIKRKVDFYKGYDNDESHPSFKKLKTAENPEHDKPENVNPLSKLKSALELIKKKNAFAVEESKSNHLKVSSVFESDSDITLESFKNDLLCIDNEIDSIVARAKLISYDT